MTKPVFTLAESLAMRYPTIWCYGPDLVDMIQEVKAHTLENENTDFYILEAMNGLKVWNKLHNRYHTVLTEQMTPMGPVLGPVRDMENSLNHLASNNRAVFVIPNAEQLEDSLDNLNTFLNLNWRDSWSSDNYNNVPVQLVFISAVNDQPPSGIASLCETVSYNLPDEEELANILTYLVEQFDIKPEFEIQEAAKAAAGLNRHDALSTFHSHLGRDKQIDVDKLRDDKFARISAKTPLEVVKPSVSIDDVAGFDKLKEILSTAMWIRNNPEEAKSYGATSNMNRFLLLGLPGCGKSMIAEALAEAVNLPLIRTGLTHMTSKWHGQTEQNTKALFRDIEALTPSVVWIDEFGRDASGGQSSDVVDGGTTTRAHGLFLTGLQELNPQNFLIAAANEIANLAPEMLRADRFDNIFFVGFPTYEQRYQILRYHLKDRDHEVSIGKVAQASASFTGAELKTTIAAATNTAISNRRMINTEDVMEALQQNKNRLWLRYQGFVRETYSRAVREFTWASDDQRSEAGVYISGQLPVATKKKAETPKVISSMA